MKPREFWVRPADVEARAFDSGYCSIQRPMLGGHGQMTDAELFRRGYFKVVEKPLEIKGERIDGKRLAAALFEDGVR